MNYSDRAVDIVCKVIKEHADRYGIANSTDCWRDILDRGVDADVAQEIMRRLEVTGYLLCLGDWIVCPKPVRCPSCRRWAEVPLSHHMHEEHPRPTTDIAFVEWT